MVNLHRVGFVDRTKRSKIWLRQYEFEVDQAEPNAERTVKWTQMERLAQGPWRMKVVFCSVFTLFYPRIGLRLRLQLRFLVSALAVQSGFPKLVTPHPFCFSKTRARVKIPPVKVAGVLVAILKKKLLRSTKASFWHRCGFDLIFNSHWGSSNKYTVIG